MQQPRDFSLHGAVDLGARQAAMKRRQQASQAPSGAGPEGSAGPAGTGGAVLDVTEETFNTEVVERSRTVPVIIDLWAEWCGPCKQLSPVLEKLATEAAGSWVLAKVDTEANPQLAAALRVQSIPMVIAVIGGQMVDGFLGAMPEAQVRQWIDQVMSAADQFGVGAGGQEGAQGPEGTPQDADDPAAVRGGPGAAGSEAAQQAAGQRPPGGPDGEAFAEAQEAMERGDFDAAEASFGKILANSPDDPVAALGLAQVRLIKRVNSYDQAAVRREAAEHPDDVTAQARVADVELATGRIEEAFDRLIGTIRRTQGDDRERARLHLLDLFSVLPPKDPRVGKARTSLSSVLF